MPHLAVCRVHIFGEALFVHSRAGREAIAQIVAHSLEPIAVFGEIGGDGNIVIGVLGDQFLKADIA